MPRSARYRAQGARFGGYSLVELVVVISIAGILAAYIAPRFWTQQTFSDRGYVDELAAALRSTQKAAVITGLRGAVDAVAEQLRSETASTLRQRL